MHGLWNNKYNEGSSKATCCTTYVSWCLQDAGLITKHVNHSNDLYSLLYSDDNWELIDTSDESDMQAGDVGIYSYNGNSEDTYHSNIYTGNSTYWDAGTDEKVKGKGATSNSMPTFVFRYKN